MEERNNRSYKTLYVLFFGIALIWLVFEVVPYKVFDSWSDRGTFGDSFGAINSLFSGLAFAGIIYTIILQKNELELQREELVMTRKELNRSAQAQEESEKALKEQAKFMAEQSKLMREQAKLMQKQTNAMEEAAKLDAINTIVSFYSQAAAAASGSNWNWHIEATGKATEYVKQLEKQLEEMRKKNGE